MSTLAHSVESKERSKDIYIEDDSVCFDSFLLPPLISKGLNTCGFRKPSPIQVKAIPVGRCGLDIIVKSKSGTGKTLVFAVVALEGINLQSETLQALILAPTREIAVQIQEVLKEIGQFFEGLFVESFIGGLPLDGDLSRCRRCHIAIGTPGRVKQLITLGYLDTQHVRLFVLDEADKLLENSFQNDINQIYNILPPKKQVIMCSATYPIEIETFLGEYMLSPTFVSAEIDSPLLLGLKQFVKIVRSSPNVVQQTKVKNDELVSILSSIPFTQCLVFSNFQTRAESVSNFLNRNNFQSTFISAAQNQVDRLNAIHDLKEFKCKILLSTDLTARGIDAANVDLVINYDIPSDTMTYLHRMGRAGRYGSSGICINLAAQGQEIELLQKILGEIGGSNLSIPKLNDSYSIEKADLSKDNMLYGVVGSKVEKSNKIRTEVIENIKHKNINKRKKSACDQDKMESAEIFNNVEKLMDLDPLLVLNELASEKFDFKNTYTDSSDTKINTPNFSVTHLLSEKCSSLEKTQSTSDEGNELKDVLKQLASDGSVTSFGNITEQSEEENTEHVMVKNKALFAVAKSLSNCATSKNDVKELSQFLQEIKRKDNLNTCLDFDKNSIKNNLESGNVVRDCQVAENIFTLAFNHAIMETGVSWRDVVLTESEIKELKECTDAEESSFESQDDDDCEDLQDFQNCSEDYDPDYDFEMAKDIEISYVQNDKEENSYLIEDSGEYSFMKWVPVGNKNPTQNKRTETGSEESPKKSKLHNNRLDFNNSFVDLPSSSARGQIVESYCEQFKKYFDQCSENLWQNGLSFESVEQFDQWFWYEWQAQINAVRDFVKQKIYIEEMAKFQQNGQRQSK